MMKQNDIKKEFYQIIKQATSQITDPKEFRMLGTDIVTALQKRFASQSQNWKKDKAITIKRKSAGMKSKTLVDKGTMFKSISVKKEIYNNKTKTHTLKINTGVVYGKYHNAETGRDWLGINTDLIKVVEIWIKGLKIK